MSRYSITIELEAATAEEAVALVAVGDIVELLNLDLLMQSHGSTGLLVSRPDSRLDGDVWRETGVESD